MQNQNSMHQQNRARRKYALILSLIGLAINYLLAHLATSLKLPLYLDNIGSAMVAGPGRIYTRHNRRLFHQPDQRHRRLQHHLLRVTDGPDRHRFRLVFQQGLL